MTKIRKNYKKIGEVAKDLRVKTHTLRFWEKEFKQISPQINKGGRRRYQPKDIEIINSIKNLLQDEGLTISGAKKKLAHSLNVAGFTGADYLNAMNRGKLTMDPNTGQYTFSTDVYSE